MTALRTDEVDRWYLVSRALTWRVEATVKGAWLVPAQASPRLRNGPRAMRRQRGGHRTISLVNGAPLPPGPGRWVIEPELTADLVHVREGPTHLAFALASRPDRSPDADTYSGERKSRTSDHTGGRPS